MIWINQIEAYTENYRFYVIAISKICKGSNFFFHLKRKFRGWRNIEYAFKFQKLKFSEILISKRYIGQQVSGLKLEASFSTLILL